MELSREQYAKIIKSIPKTVEIFRFSLDSKMSLNKVTRNHHFVNSRHKKRDMVDAEFTCYSSRKFSDKVWFEIYYFMVSKIDPIDNLPSSLKPILDGMVNAKVIRDDSSKIIQSPIISWCVNIPRKRQGTNNNFVIMFVAEHPIFMGQPFDVTENFDYLFNNSGGCNNP